MGKRFYVSPVEELAGSHDRWDRDQVAGFEQNGMIIPKPIDDHAVSAVATTPVEPVPAPDWDTDSYTPETHCRPDGTHVEGGAYIIPG